MVDFLNECFRYFYAILFIAGCAATLAVWAMTVNQGSKGIKGD